MFNSSIEFEKLTCSAGVLVMCDKCFAVGGFARVFVAGDDCFGVVIFAKVLVAGKYCLAVIAFARILVASKNCNAVLFKLPDRRKRPGSFHNSDCCCKDQCYGERGFGSYGLAFSGFPLVSWVVLRVPRKTPDHVKFW
jgi:hypothetical protein